MRSWQYGVATGLGVVCLGVSIALVIVGRSTLRVQRQAAEQQARINNGVLGERGQRMSSAIMGDMAGVAVTNTSMRELLTVHGYSLRADASGTLAATDVPVADGEMGGRDE